MKKHKYKSNINPSTQELAQLNEYAMINRNEKAGSRNDFTG
ncbi:MAG TPA: hypothetical protein VIK14_15275 [Ignavibacteria bacterium]